MSLNTMKGNLKIFFPRRNIFLCRLSECRGGVSEAATIAKAWQLQVWDMLRLRKRESRRARKPKSRKKWKSRFAGCSLTTSSDGLLSAWTLDVIKSHPNLAGHTTMASQWQQYTYPPFKVYPEETRNTSPPRFNSMWLYTGYINGKVIFRQCHLTFLLCATRKSLG